MQKLKKAMEKRLSILSANAWAQGRGFIASAGLGDSARARAHLYTRIDDYGVDDRRSRFTRAVLPELLRQAYLVSPFEHPLRSDDRKLESQTQETIYEKRQVRPA